MEQTVCLQYKGQVAKDVEINTWCENHKKYKIAYLAGNNLNLKGLIYRPT
jgi:hypothetical protein